MMFKYSHITKYNDLDRPFKNPGYKTPAIEMFISSNQIFHALHCHSWSRRSFKQTCKCKCNLFTHKTLRSSEAHLNMFVRSRSNWNLQVLVFEERGKPVPREKPLRARTRTNNKLNPRMTLGPGVEPGPHWWEASALTTAPSLLP